MNDCIEWKQCRDKANYGVSWFQGKKIAAHRKAWILANGPIPNGMFVLHKCDNPPCVNPDHLFIGTHADNMRDKAAKGRMRLDGGRPRFSAKVSEGDIGVIRALKGKKKQSEIASIYGLCQSAVSRIMTRSNWSDI